MIIEGSSDIVVSSERIKLKGDEAEVLHLVDGKAIVLTHNALAIFKNHAAIDDPFGQGLVDMVALSDDVFPNGEAPTIERYNAGFVGLNDNKALIILPNAIKLYANKEDALYNRSALASVSLIKS